MHAIQGLLLRVEGAATAMRIWPDARCIALQSDMIWVPLRGASEGVQSIDEGEVFDFWSNDLCARLIALSHEHAVAYFETEYFGGEGTQHATLFRAGVRELRAGSVNEALSRLGVIVGGARDAWDAVGLSDHRRMP